MIGIDVVAVERLRAALDRSPGLERRMFTTAERDHARACTDPVVHLAGSLAAKEAVIKAASLGLLVAWARKIEIVRAADGAPAAFVDCGGERRRIPVSISHDGPIAAAVAFAPAPGDPWRR